MVTIRYVDFSGRVPVHSSLAGSMPGLSSCFNASAVDQISDSHSVGQSVDWHRASCFGLVFNCIIIIWPGAAVE